MICNARTRHNAMRAAAARRVVPTNVTTARRPVRETERAIARALASCAVSLCVTLAPMEAFAAPGSKPAPLFAEGGQAACTNAALDAFADVRAKFSLEVSTGALPEAVLTLSGCDYSERDLHGKVLSGTVMDEASFEKSDLSATEMSRASVRNANLRGADLRSANCYEARFDGSDLRGVNFENALLSNATFGKSKGQWADVAGANFEGALVSSSDARKLCDNPTLDLDGEIAIGGCR